MKKYLFVSLFLLLALCLGSGEPSAQEPQEPQKGLLRNIIATFRPLNVEEQQNLAASMELSADQKGQMKTLHDKYAGQSTTLRERYSKAYEDVVALMAQDTPDKGRVNQVLKNFHDIHAKVLEEEVNYYMEMKSILTPAQNNVFWGKWEQSRIR